jgi:hypothetical protein
MNKLKQELNKILKQIDSISVVLKNDDNTDEFNAELDSAAASIEECLNIIDRDEAYDDLQNQMDLD